MYIGPLAPREETTWLLSRGKLAEGTVTMSPGLLQIFNEILVNAVDRQFDSTTGTMSMINVEVDTSAGSISVENDGGRLPVTVHEGSGLYVPSLVFGEFMSGDNFDDSRKRFVGGRNGIGAKATNVFSNRFEVEVADPATKLRLVQTWTDNMATAAKPVITKLEGGARQRVKVTFWPDLPRFGLRKLDADHLKVLKSRTFDAAACTNKDIDVSFNGQSLKLGSFKEFAKAALGPKVEVTQVLYGPGDVRVEVAAAVATQGFQALGLVNGIRCSAGTHVKTVVDQLAEGIAGMATKAQELRPSAVKRHLTVVVKALVDRPEFDSQTKSRLTTPASKLGFELNLDPKFIKKVAKLGVLEAALAEGQAPKRTAFRHAVSIALPPKLDDAIMAGTGKEDCTLILTEGDSAKGLAVAGVSKVGRRNYGIFPLRGKFLNVRTATKSQLKNNTEVLAVSDILGLRSGMVFTDARQVKKLRYQRVMIFADQDLDGHHITGLLINFFQSTWPSLLKVCPNFIQRFATPIVKIFPKAKNKPAVGEFLTQADYAAWQREQAPGWERRHRIKYYKGLGTSKREEAISYFSNMKRYVLDLVYKTAGDRVSVERSFGGGGADDRKAWIQKFLEKGDTAKELDYTKASASVQDFFDLQFVHWCSYDNERSIPLLIDGLKPSQRKVLHVLGKFKQEKRVAQIAGLVSAETSYHHGEQSLVETVVALAQTFVGTNNVNLLIPSGDFGTRLLGRKQHASARYIYTEPSELFHKIFRPEDEDVLRPQWEDGQVIEPHELLPVVPVLLMNGFKGIGTGWSSDGPNFNPVEVTDMLEAIIRGEEPKEILPWYQGFRGTIEKDGEGRFFSEGTWRILEGEDVVEVKELPVGVWTDDYVAELGALARRKKIWLSVFKCRDHDDENVHILISFSQQELAQAGMLKGDLHADIGRLLKLRRRVLSRMFLFHAEEVGAMPALKFFESPQAVVRAFHGVRRQHYVRRKEMLLGKLNHSATLLENRFRFLRAVGGGEVQLQGVSIAKVEERLEELGLRPMCKSPFPEDGDTPDYEYLLSMPYKSITMEQADALERRMEDAVAELTKLRGTAEDELWLADLDDFREAYRKWAVKQGPAKQVGDVHPEDLAEARTVFRREGRKVATRGVAVSLTLDARRLNDMSVAALKEMCAERGLLKTGKRQTIVERLLVTMTLGNTKKDWNQLPIDDLRAHLQMRQLNAKGTRAALLNRLEKGGRLRSVDEMNTKEMRAELKEHKLRLSGNKGELAQLLRNARQRASAAD